MRKIATLILFFLMTANCGACFWLLLENIANSRTGWAGFNFMTIVTCVIVAYRSFDDTLKETPDA